MPRKRLTRQEQREHTRSSLLASAAKLFACKGMQQASIDEVAEDAGFTKGAFYANFKNKEELFLAMLDERFAQRIEELDRVTRSDAEPQDQARQAGIEFMRAISADPEWERLFFEFTAYAARNEDFREELVTRYQSLRERIAALLRERAESFDFTPPFTADEGALMIVAMGNGIAMEKLLEPDVVSEELYGTMMLIFFSGMRAVAEARAAAAKG